MRKFLILDSLHSTLNNKVWPVGKIPLISLKDVQKLRYSFPKIASKWKLKKNNNNNKKEKRSTDSKTFHDINDKYRSERVLIQRSKFFHDEIDDAQRYKLWPSYIQIFVHLFHTFKAKSTHGWLALYRNWKIKGGLCGLHLRGGKHFQCNLISNCFYMEKSTRRN